MNNHTPTDGAAQGPATALRPVEAAGLRVSVRGNTGSQIIVAGGSVTMTAKPLLPAADVPAADLDAVRLAWVDGALTGSGQPVVAELVTRLTGEGPALAVIDGTAGLGKRSVGLRALWEVAQKVRVDGEEPLAIQEVSPDWEDPDSPDATLLPAQPGTVYLLDVAAEMSGWRNRQTVAGQLLAHAQALRDVGSFLVVVTAEHTWPESSPGLAAVVTHAITRPPALTVARKHLELLHRKAERLHLLNSSPAGEATHLLTAGSSPADAARLARLLATADDSPAGVRTAIDTFLQWRHQVQKVFETTDDNPDDRALLIAGVFLDGHDALSVQDAARALLKDNRKTDVRTILTGPDLRARLESVGAQVRGRTVSFDYRPGYTLSVVLHLWQQRADIHPHLLEWLDAMIQPKQPGADRIAAISDLLVALATAENDIRVIDRFHTWIDSGPDSTEHRDLIARILGIAAESDPLGATVRARLLAWAQEPSPAVATTIAKVCQGAFADQYPRQALVRLRHVLDRPEKDEAVATAQEALRDIATREGHLPRVWATVLKWATERKHLAGHRAFLALLDPTTDTRVLQALLTSAQNDTGVKEALVRGWSAALADDRVVAESKHLLTAWAQAKGAGLVPPDIVVEVLQDVVVQHLYSTPVAALIFGEPGVPNDEAVISLRKEIRLPPALAAALDGGHPHTEA
ncbi:hypothetical protein [Kitasatospora sp. NPDC098663]|uniref:hypothetical protein n=1 Tax=Kitasatospora sp. NPDC098663 TaxID=3364096 RepID=UPI0038118423